ncbi:hypothetical protein [Novosphingobium sp.]|uniref:hypothetical protein n=1 Tax=Novosphingobium sp. TaxID=1874826 RepID=UPI001DA9AA6A|nr:hypothetical protein [Novosphingobium sp.]MBX9664570.1 hypothetical protein [Novosphingobium sp.]
MWQGPLGFWKRRPQQFRVFARYVIPFLDIMLVIITFYAFVVTIIVTRDLFYFYSGISNSIDKGIFVDLFLSILILYSIMFMKNVLKTVSLHIDRD